jgi:hypothetical protein
MLQPVSTNISNRQVYTMPAGLQVKILLSGSLGFCTVRFLLFSFASWKTNIIIFG